MSLSRAQLKSLFERNDVMTQESFENFIDGVFNLNDDTMIGVTGPTGATGTISEINTLDFTDLGATAPDYLAGRLFYQNSKLNLYNDINDVTLQIGEEFWLDVRNISGATIPNGSVVYISGAQGQRPTIELASNETHETSHTIGIATHDILNNTNGYVTLEGLVRGIDTNSLIEGDEIFLGATAGSFTNIKPEAPTHTVSLGVVNVSGINGSIIVSITDAVDINDLTEVLITNPKDRDRLGYNANTQRWENQTPQDLRYISVGATGATSVNLEDTSERIFVKHSVPFTVIGATAPSKNTVYEIIDESGTCFTNNITFDGNGKTIRGLSTWLLDEDWYVLKIVYNGTEYNII